MVDSTSGGSTAHLDSSDSSSGGSAAPLQCCEMDRHTPGQHTATPTKDWWGQSSDRSSSLMLLLLQCFPVQPGDQECGSGFQFCSRGVIQLELSV